MAAYLTIWSPGRIYLFGAESVLLGCRFRSKKRCNFVSFFHNKFFCGSSRAAFSITRSLNAFGQSAFTQLLSTTTTLVKTLKTGLISELLIQNVLNSKLCMFNCCICSLFLILLFYFVLLCCFKLIKSDILYKKCQVCNIF